MVVLLVANIFTSLFLEGQTPATSDIMQLVRTNQELFLILLNEAFESKSVNVQ